MQLEIEVSADTTTVIERLRSLKPAKVDVKRHMTGDVWVMIAARVTAAASIVHSIEKIINGTKSIIRSKKLKSPKGTLVIEGFTTEDTLRIIEALHHLKLGDRASDR